MIRLHYAELFAPDDPEQEAVAGLHAERSSLASS
jgi:hypothetical protein